jgi:3-oxoacyl-[acyl-carrier protein] reductase
MGEVIAVTGAGRGIGLAIAQAFAREGKRLALHHHGSAAALGEVVALAASAGGAVHLVPGDFTERANAEAFVRSAEAHFGRIDVLVNNAGVLVSAPAHETAWADWDRTLAINLDATWACMRAALPGMLSRGRGRIINIASELGLIGFPTYAAYCASKGAVIALTKAVAKEVAPAGILVNCVAPGPVETDMLIHDTIEYNDETRIQIPLRRFGRPEEIAATVAFLAGPGGSFFVGQAVSPNGGTAI